MTLTRCCHRQALWIFPSHLLSFRRVGLGVHFEERKLLTVVVIHPFTEVVANVKPSAERSNNESGQNRFINEPIEFFPLCFVVFFRACDLSCVTERVWPHRAIFHRVHWSVVTHPGVLQGCFLFCLFFQPWEVCVVAFTSLVFVGSGAQEFMFWVSGRLTGHFHKVAC